MSEWQPIETAPKDGSQILLYGTRFNMVKANPEIIQGRYGRGWWGTTGPLSHVTHWQPLPAQPTK